MVSSEHCTLTLRQGAEHARVAVVKEKDRQPVDPPPIIQLKISTMQNRDQHYLQSPYFFMACSLLPATDKSGLPSSTLGATLVGTLVSSLHWLKDPLEKDGRYGAFFIFNDLYAKHEGKFRFQFTLYEMRGDECYYVKSIDSSPFQVYTRREFQGMAASTDLVRSFSVQGVKVRVRREPKALLGKNGPAHDDSRPRRNQPKKPKAIDEDACQPTDSAGFPEHRRRHVRKQRASKKVQSGQRSAAAPTTSYPRTASKDQQPSTAARSRLERTQAPFQKSSIGQHQQNQMAAPMTMARVVSGSRRSFCQQSPMSPSSHCNFSHSPQAATFQYPVFDDRPGNAHAGASIPFQPNSTQSLQDLQIQPESLAFRYSPHTPPQDITAQSFWIPPQSGGTQQSGYQVSLMTCNTGGGLVTPGYVGAGPPARTRTTSTPVFSNYSGATLARFQPYQEFALSAVQHPDVLAGNMPCPTTPIGLMDGNELPWGATGDMFRLLFTAIPEFEDPDQRCWVLQHKNHGKEAWGDVYCFTETEFLPQHIAVMNFKTGDVRGSFFNHVTSCGRNIMDEGRVVGTVNLAGAKCNRRVWNGEEWRSEVVRVCEGEVDRWEVLESVFGILLGDEERKGIKGFGSDSRGR
ncbi:hypothetical protein JHW43_008133 [Diplocarpon mali]|nr:hypothetical protein JHW43_008133 [Diplocarpon mali]